MFWTVNLIPFIRVDNKCQHPLTHVHTRMCMDNVFLWIIFVQMYQKKKNSSTQNRPLRYI